jgi:hypothetical protein
MPVTAPAHDQTTAPTWPPGAVPAKPKHVVGQLTTAELVRERSMLEAALRRPFSDDIKRLLSGRLEAVLAEQDERACKRAEATAAAKAAAPKGHAGSALAAPDSASCPH